MNMLSTNDIIIIENVLRRQKINPMTIDMVVVRLKQTYEIQSAIGKNRADLTEIQRACDHISQYIADGISTCQICGYKENIYI